MLNSKGLSDLLSKNSDGRLCKRWMIMTANGTLLAYTQPTDIRELRRQAAMAAMSWQEHGEDQQTTDSVPNSPEEAQPRSQSLSVTGLLRTLTIENEKSNLIVRKLQSRLLLVLEGGVPPRKRAFGQKITPEGPGDAPYPSLENRTADSVPGSSASSVTGSTATRTSASHKTLVLQRRKLDAMAAAVASDFKKTGFKMPEDTKPKLF